MIELVRKPFYIMRHGQTTDNLMDVISGGGRDPLLTPQGFRDAYTQHEVYMALEKKPEEVIASDRLRSYQTLLEVVGTEVDSEKAPPHVVRDPALNERLLGDNDGKISYAKLMEMKARGEEQPGAQSEESHAVQVIPAVNKYLERSANPPLFVIHAGTARRMMEAMGLGSKIEVPNAQMFECVPEGEHGWKVNALAVLDGKLERRDITTGMLRYVSQPQTNLGAQL